MELIHEEKQTAAEAGAEAEAVEEPFLLACSLSYPAQALCLGMSCPLWPGPSYVNYTCPEARPMEDVQLSFGLSRCVKLTTKMNHHRLSSSSILHFIIF